MSYKPNYLNGKCGSISCAAGCVPLSNDNRDYREFKAWLAKEKKTLEQWLQENPPPEPTPITKEQQLAAAQEQIYRNHIAELSKKVMELRFIVATETGVKLSDISPELEAKLAECDSLKAEEKP